MFALQGGQTFYSLLLAPDTPESDAEVLEEILAESTAFQDAGGVAEAGNEEVVEEVAQDIVMSEGGLQAAAAAEEQGPTTSERIIAGAYPALASHIRHSL